MQFNYQRRSEKNIIWNKLLCDFLIEEIQAIDVACGIQRKITPSHDG